MFLSQDEYQTLISSDTPVLRGWDMGAQEVNNMERHHRMEESGEEVAFLLNPGKKFTYSKSCPHSGILFTM